MPRYPFDEAETSAFDSFATASDSQGDLSRTMLESSSDGIAFYYDEIDRSDSSRIAALPYSKRLLHLPPGSSDELCQSPGPSHSAEVSRELIAVRGPADHSTNEPGEAEDSSDDDRVEDLTGVNTRQDPQPKPRKLSVARPTPLSMIREESMNSLSYSLSHHSIQSLSTPPKCSTPASKQPWQRGQCPPAPLPRTSLPSALSPESEDTGSDYSNRTVIIHDLDDDDDDDDASDTFSLSSCDSPLGKSLTPASSTRTRTATGNESVDELDRLLTELKAAEVCTADRAVAQTPRQVSGVQTRAAARRAAEEAFRAACSASPCPARAAKARHRSVGPEASPTRAVSARVLPTPFAPLGPARNTRSKTASPCKAKGKTGAAAHSSPSKSQQRRILPLRPVKSAARLRGEVITAPLQISKRANFDAKPWDGSVSDASPPRKAANKTPTRRYALRRIGHSDNSLRSTSSLFRGKKNA